MMYSGDDFYGDEITSPLARPTPTDAAGGRDPQSVTLDAIYAVGGRVDATAGGYILDLDGDRVWFSTLAALAAAFAEHEAARLSDAYDRADAAHDLVAELRERMTTEEARHA